MNEPSRNLENPFEPSVSLPFLIARLGGSAFVIAAVISGVPLFEWMSVPVLLWFLAVVWGRHILFIDNLNGIPTLGSGAPSGTATVEPLPTVSLIVPVRNEEMGIEPAVRALAAIEYPGLEILMINDHSSDGTPRILQRMTLEYPRLRVLAAPAVPAGWTGKTHASWFGFQQSDPSARWLLFTDARVMFSPDAVSRAVAHAEANRLAFLSCILRFDGVTLAEESIAILQNRGLMMSARAFGGGGPAAPFGLGAFSLIRRDVYVAAGGHSAFPSHPIEDFMLAKSAQQCGAAISVAVASGLLSIRRYHGFADMRRRLVRTLRLAASDRVIDLVNRISLEVSLSVLPLPIAIVCLVRMWLAGEFQAGLAVIALLALLAYLAGTSTPRSCRKICRFRSWVAWLHPLGASLWTWFLLLAIAERSRGQSISWRGRAIDPPTAAALVLRPPVVDADRS